MKKLNKLRPWGWRHALSSCRHLCCWDMTFWWTRVKCILGAGSKCKSSTRPAATVLILIILGVLIHYVFGCWNAILLHWPGVKELLFQCPLIWHSTVVVDSRCFSRDCPVTGVPNSTVNITNCKGRTFILVYTGEFITTLS